MRTTLSSPQNKSSTIHSPFQLKLKLTSLPPPNAFWNFFSGNKRVVVEAERLRLIELSVVVRVNGGGGVLDEGGACTDLGKRGTLVKIGLLNSREKSSEKEAPRSGGGRVVRI